MPTVEYLAEIALHRKRERMLLYQIKDLREIITDNMSDLKLSSIEAYENIPCKGVELPDGSFTGCDQSSGDCQSCGR